MSDTDPSPEKLPPEDRSPHREEGDPGAGEPDLESAEKIPEVDRPGVEAGEPGPEPAEMPPETGGPAPPNWRKRLRLAGIVVGVGLILWMVFTWLTWPDVGALATANPSTTAFIERYRETRREAGEPDGVLWQPVSWDRISPNLKRAVVASEDTEFFFHDGFSRHEMAEAIKKALREGEAPRGASTITQQVAKNLWLTPRRSLTRKLREALLTRQLEKHLSKRRILEIYLNVVEFGPGIYGAEAAARHYFSLPAADLTPRQGAMLAAGLPRPKTWNPSSKSEYYRARVDRILEIEDRLDYLDRYVGARAPGGVEVRPPEVLSPVP